MNYETLNYIRSHKYLYQLLRDESHYYEDIYKDNSFVYELNKIAKKKYGVGFIHKIENISNKLDVLSAFLDVFQ